MDLSYSPVPIDTVATARDFQDRVARLAGAGFVIAAVLGAASTATYLATQTHASESGSGVHEFVHTPPLKITEPGPSTRVLPLEMTSSLYQTTAATWMPPGTP